MIWLWKGQYGATIGAEIGLYVEDFTVRITYGRYTYSQKHYRAAYDSERIYMTFTLYKNGSKLFSRPKQKYWWSTGFKFGIKWWWQSLSMNISLTFDYSSMADAFYASLKQQGIYGTKNYKTISFWW